jgi:hypothetical protein
MLSLSVILSFESLIMSLSFKILSGVMEILAARTLLVLQVNMRFCISFMWWEDAKDATRCRLC